MKSNSRDKIIHTSDHVELALTNEELGAVNAIYDHLDLMPLGVGIEVDFIDGDRRVVFLTPLKSQKDRLANISIAHLDISYRRLHLAEVEELLVYLDDVSDLSWIVNASKRMQGANKIKISHWDEFMSDLRDAQEDYDCNTVEGILSGVSEATSLDMLKLKLGLSVPVEVKAEKYVDSTFKGKKIESIVCHPCGVVFLKTSDGFHRFKILHMRPLDEIHGDYILCELQEATGLDLSK